MPRRCAYCRRRNHLQIAPAQQRRHMQEGAAESCEALLDQVMAKAIAHCPQSQSGRSSFICTGVGCAVVWPLTALVMARIRNGYAHLS